MVGRLTRFNEADLRAAVAASFNWSETLRNLGYCPSGGNSKTIRKYVEQWNIDISHFDPERNRYRNRSAIPLEQILVAGSKYSRGHLKARLYEQLLKQRICEMCGQDESWNGVRMSLILDHINGIRDDNRLENLRIVCPNCAATLPTHCGAGARKPPVEIACERCGLAFVRRFAKQRFCSRECGQRAGRIGGRGFPRPDTRRVVRPPYEQLLCEIEETNYSAVGRKYGVTDKAVRKWVRAYEREFARRMQEN